MKVGLIENKEIVISAFSIVFLYLISFPFKLGEVLSPIEHILLGFLLAEIGSRFYDLTKRFGRVYWQIGFVVLFAMIWEILEMLGIAQKIVFGLKPEFDLFNSLIDFIDNLIGGIVSIYMRRK